MPDPDDQPELEPRPEVAAAPAPDALVQHPLVGRPGGMGALAAALCAWLVVFSALFAPAASSGVPVFALLAGAFWLLPPILLGVFLGVVPAKVWVGDDGVEVRHLVGRWRVLYRDVLETRVEPSRTTLLSRRGRPLHLFWVVPRGASVMGPGLTEGIRASAERARTRAPSELEVELTRGESQAEAWFERLRSRLDPRVDYRLSSFDREAYARLVEDPLAEPTARAGAAWILKASGLGERERARVASAATRAVAPGLRIALESAVEEDLSEAERGAGPGPSRKPHD